MKKINELPVATSASSTDKFVIETSDGTRSVTKNNIDKDLIKIQASKPSETENKIWINTNTSDSIELATEDEITDFVKVQAEEPTSEGTKIWVDTSNQASIELATQDEVDNLKREINRFEIIDVLFNPGTGYIVTNGSVGSTVSLSPTASSLYYYTYLPCNKDDVFIVNVSGGMAPRAWCFTDEDLKIISNAGNNVVAENQTLIAPDDGYLICNTSVSYTGSYVKYIRKVIDTVDDLIIGSSTQNMAGLPNKDFYYSVSDGCIVNRRSALIASTGFVKVIPGCTYQWRGAAAKIEGGYFAEDATLTAGVASISAVTFTTLNNISMFTVPDGVSFVMLNITMTSEDTIGAYYLTYGFYQQGNLAYKKAVNILDLYPLSDIIKAYRVYRQSDGYSGINVVAGYEKNYVARDLHGCTISGGGFPGYSNKIGAMVGNVWDGTSPASEKQENDTPITGTGADFSVIGGGYDNVANGLASVLTGFHCIIDTTATHGTISGGSLHKIQNCNYSTICGGTQNKIISGNSAVIGGGSHNTATGQWSQILGGDSNTASGKNAVAIGRDNTSAHENAFAHGKGAVTSNYGQDAWSTYPLAENGDRQVSKYQLFIKTTDTTAKYLETNTNTRAIIPDGYTWLYEVRVIARSATKTKAWIAKGCAQRNGSTITSIGTPSVETFGDAADLDFRVSFAGSSSILFVCTGNTEEVQWFGKLEAVQLKI